LPGQAPIRARPANYLVSLATGVRGVHREITRNTYTQSPTCGGGGGYVKFGAVLVNGPLKITVLFTNFQKKKKKKKKFAVRSCAIPSPSRLRLQLRRLLLHSLLFK